MAPGPLYSFSATMSSKLVILICTLVNMTNLLGDETNRSDDTRKGLCAAGRERPGKAVQREASWQNRVAWIEFLSIGSHLAMSVHADYLPASALRRRITVILVFFSIPSSEMAMMLPSLSGNNVVTCF